MRQTKDSSTFLLLSQGHWLHWQFLFVFIALKRVVWVVLKRTISMLYNVFSVKQHCHFYFSYGSLILWSQKNTKSSNGSIAGYLVKLTSGQVVHIAWAYPCFHSMDEVPVHCSVTPSIKIQCYPFIHLGGEEHCKSVGRISHPRAQCIDLSQGYSKTWTVQSGVHCTDH